MEELQTELEHVRGELREKGEEIAELKTATDTAKTELAEANVRNEAALLAMEDELRETKRAADETQQELDDLKKASRLTTWRRSLNSNGLKASWNGCGHWKA